MHGKGERSVMSDYIMSLSKIISHRLLASLENILLSFLAQLDTTAIKLELVNRLKTKGNGYQFPLCASLFLNIYALWVSSPAHRVLHWPKKAKNGSFKSFGRYS
jgi:hypothetical protein